jgi:hypothetical protein
MNARTPCFLMLLFGFSAYSHANTGEQFIAKVSGRISVNADGAVAGVTLDNVTSPDVRGYLEKQIRSWEFHPMTVNGQPMPADAGFHFRLLASFGADGRLDQIAFQDVIVEPTDLEREAKAGVRDASRRVAPQYPYIPLKEGIEAELLVAAKISPSGTVSDVVVSEMAVLGALQNVSPSLLAKARNDFIKSATGAVKQWRYSPERLAEADCIDGCTANISVTFELSGAPWKAYRVLPVPGVLWLAAGQVKDIEGTKSKLVLFKKQPSNQPIDAGS